MSEKLIRSWKDNFNYKKISTPINLLFGIIIAFFNVYSIANFFLKFDFSSALGILQSLLLLIYKLIADWPKFMVSIPFIIARYSFFVLYGIFLIARGISKCASWHYGELQKFLAKDFRFSQPEYLYVNYEITNFTKLRAWLIGFKGVRERITFKVSKDKAAKVLTASDELKNTLKNIADDSNNLDDIKNKLNEFLSSIDESDVFAIADINLKEITKNSIRKILHAIDIFCSTPVESIDKVCECVCNICDAYRFDIKNILQQEASKRKTQMQIEDSNAANSENTEDPNITNSENASDDIIQRINSECKIHSEIFFLE
jgi:hypothetical protein